MSWHEVRDDDNPHHILYVLLNDRTDVLARVETYNSCCFDVWIMDLADTTLLRQAGVICDKLTPVRGYCVQVLEGKVAQNRSLAAELRPLHTGWPR